MSVFQKKLYQKNDLYQEAINNLSLNVSVRNADTLPGKQVWCIFLSVEIRDSNKFKDIDTTY